MNVTFYDVEPEARAQRIATLVSAAWERGRRLLVACADSAEASELDTLLWSHDAVSFIPHEIVAQGDSPRDPDARIVLVSGEHDPIGADILLQASPVSSEFARSYAFVIDLVDHRSEALLAASRQRYKAWADAGVKPTFIKR